jgi:hypothetical protein
MALLIVVFVAELLLAFPAYFIFRKFYGNRSLIALAISASLIGLIAGWTIGYLSSANTVIRDYRDKVKVEVQQSRGTNLTEDEWHQLLEKLKVDPGVKYMSHKGAAIHAVPAFVVVFLIMVRLARKHQKRSRDTE